MNIPKSFLLIFSCLLCSSMAALGNDDEFFLKDGYKYKIIRDGEVEVFWNNFPDSVPVCHDTLRILSSVSTTEGEYKVTKIGRQAFVGQLGVRHVIIDEGIEEIDYEAFMGCTNLKSVWFPNSIRKCCGDAFPYCPRLESIKSGGPYDDCNALIETDDMLWLGCKGTVIPPGVETICDSAFEMCAGLEELTIPEGVREIGPFAFYGCANLKSIHLPSTLEIIGRDAFSHCTSLTSIEIPANVNYIVSMLFAGCINLRSVTVSPDNQYYDSREGCNAIVRSSDSTIISACGATTIPEGIVGLDRRSFQETGIRELHFPSTIRNIPADEFYGADKIATITVADGNPRYCSPEGSNALLSLDGDTLVLGCSTTLIPPSVTVIGNYAFCRRMERVVLTLPEGVEEIKYQAFYGNDRLFYVQLPAAVKSLGSEAFANCKELCIVDLPSGFESIGDECFSGCTNLNVINTGSKLRFIGERAFQDCPCEKYIREKFADICR